MKGKCLSLSLVLPLSSFFLSFFFNSPPFLVFLPHFAGRGFSFCSSRARCSLARRKNANARIIVGLIRFCERPGERRSISNGRGESRIIESKREKRGEREREPAGERRSTRDSIYTVRKRTAHVRVNYPRHREARLCTAIRWPIARGQLFFFFFSFFFFPNPSFLVLHRLSLLPSFSLSLSLSLSLFSLFGPTVSYYFSPLVGARRTQPYTCTGWEKGCRPRDKLSPPFWLRVCRGACARE